MVERLTKKSNVFPNEYRIIFNSENDTLENTIAAVNKLGEYEDAEEQGLIVRLPCKVGDTVYDVVKCDVGTSRIFKMRVGCIATFGSIHKNKVWNMYLEDTYTKAYRSFCDFGKTVFLTREEAERALKEDN